MIDTYLAIQLDFFFFSYQIFPFPGDFRATPSMKQLEVLKGLNVNTLFLDTT